MPLKQFKCSVCGASAPKKYLREGKLKDRMSWLRHHYQRRHPSRFKEWYRR